MTTVVPEGQSYSLMPPRESGPFMLTMDIMDKALRSSLALLKTPVTTDVVCFVVC